MQSESLRAWEHFLRSSKPWFAFQEAFLKLSGHSTKGYFKNSLCTLFLLMCTFRACELESTFLEIHNIVLPLTKYLLKVLGHSTTGELQNSPCMLDLPICTLKSNLPESTLLVIQNFALPSVELLLKFQVILPNKTTKIVHAHWIFSCAYSNLMCL